MTGINLTGDEERTSGEQASIRVEGMVLAAGLSTRMSYCKLEAEIKGMPLVQHVVNSALNSKLDRVVLVTGARDFSYIEDSFNAPLLSKFHRVKNPFPESGMASSMRTGLEAVGPGIAGAMVILADQPGISAEVINELIAEFSRDNNRIVVPYVYGRKTTPVIFPADLFPELGRVTGDLGGREVLAANAGRITGVELGTLYDDTDVDTPEDLDKIRKSFSMKSKAH